MVGSLRKLISQKLKVQSANQKPWTRIAWPHLFNCEGPITRRRRKGGGKLPHSKLLQRLNANFLKKNDVVVPVILETDVTFIESITALRLKVQFAFRARVLFRV